MAMMERPRPARQPLIQQPVMQAPPAVASAAAPPVVEHPTVAPAVASPYAPPATVSQAEAPVQEAPLPVAAPLQAHSALARQPPQSAVAAAVPRSISGSGYLSEPRGNMYQAFVNLSLASSSGVLPSGSATKPFEQRVAETTSTLNRMRSSDPFTLARTTVAQQDIALDEAARVQSERAERRDRLADSVESGQVLKGLQNARSTVRETAVEKVDAMQVAVPNDLLISLLQDPSWSVRSFAAGRLKAQSADALLYTMKVVPLLGHQEEFVRESALDVLLEAEAEVLQQIPGERMGELLQESSYTIRASSASLLTKLVAQNPSLHMKEMIVLLQHETTSVREVAVEVLYNLSEHQGMIPFEIVLRLLKDSSLSVSTWAGQWFKAQSETTIHHLGDLLAMLQDSNSQTREMVVGVLLDLGDEAAQQIPPEILAFCLQDTSWTVRSWAVDAFRAKKARAAENAKHVWPLLRRCDTMGRESAVEALQAMDLQGVAASQVGAEVLLPLLKDSSSWVRAFSVEAFKAQGAQAVVHAPMVLPLLQDDISSTRESAAEVMLNMGQAAWVTVPTDFWISLTTDISGVVQELARAALRAQGKEYTY